MNTISQLGKKAILILSEEGGIAFLKRFEMFFVRQIHRLLKKRQKIVVETKQQEEWPIEKPLVSVIIPCYNYGKFIKGAIESVLAQTFQRFEIIVINDGSTQELTKDVLRNLCYEKTTIIHQVNQGLSQTRNNGAFMATGKYICYLDADDLIEPTYLEKTLSLLESDESLGSCYSWVQCFGDADSVWETEDFDPFFLKQYTASSSHSVIRKTAWEKVRELNGSGFLTKYDGYLEDWVFWIDMVQYGYRGQVIPEPLIRYRVHKNSLGATHKSGFDNMLKTLHEDRKQFFYDRSYTRDLAKKLNRRIYVTNNRANLFSPSEVSAVVDR